MLRLSVCSLLVACMAAGAAFAADTASTTSLPPNTRSAGMVTNARRALSQNLGRLQVDQVSVQKVLDYLRNASGANIVVNWKALEASGVQREAPVSLDVRGLTLTKALQLVLDQASPAAPLTYTVDQNVISITTQEEADKVMITKVYIVDDLVMPDMVQQSPPSFDLNAVTKSNNNGSGGGGGGNQQSIFQNTNQGSNAGTQGKTADQKGEELAELIRAVVRPEIWKEAGGPAAMRYFSGKLIVTAPQSVQEMIGGDVNSTTGALRVGM